MGKCNAGMRRLARGATNWDFLPVFKQRGATQGLAQVQRGQGHQTATSERQECGSACLGIVSLLVSTVPACVTGVENAVVISRTNFW